MTDAAMLPSDVGAALSLRDFIDACENDPLPAGKDPLPPEKARRLDQLVARAVQMAGILKIAWRMCTQEGSVWETDAYARRVQVVEFLARIVEDSLTRTQELVARTRSKHPEWVVPREAAEVGTHFPAAREILTKARELSMWLARERPPVNEEMIRRSCAALDHGEGEAITDIVARLKSGGPLVQE